MKRAVTDSGGEVRHDWTAKAGISNLMEMLLAVHRGLRSPRSRPSSAAAATASFKEAVAEAVVAGLAPFRTAYDSLDDAEVSRLVEASAMVARDRAEVFQQAVRRRVGLAV